MQNMSFAVVQDLHNQLIISMVAHLHDDWLVLGYHFQHIIQHILHLSIQIQKSILELTPALDSTSKYPMYHYCHKILLSGYELFAVPVY
jgi:hypothetical protein